MIPADEALEDLRFLRALIDRTRLRGADAAPYFVLWGGIWLVAALLTLPPFRLPPGPVWLSLVATGFVGSAVLGRRDQRRAGATPSRAPYLLKLWFWSLAMILVLAAAFIVLTHAAGRVTVASPAFWVVLIGVWYAIGGFFLGWPVLGLGLLLVAIGVASRLVGLPLALANAVAGLAGGVALLVTGGWLLRTRTRHG